MHIHVKTAQTTLAKSGYVFEIGKICTKENVSLGQEHSTYKQ